MFDIVIPKNNEAELAKQAKKLGYSELVFLRNFKNLGEIKQYTETLCKLPIEAKVGLLIEPKKRSDLNKTRELSKTVEITVAKSNSTEDVNRIIFESSNLIATDIESSTGKDHLHYRQSCMNQVLAKLAKANNITYALNFSRLLALPPNQRVLLMGRWIQNIEILSKYGSKVEIYSFASSPWDLRSRSDLDAFLRILS